MILLVLVETGWAPLHDADRALSGRLHRVAVDQSGFTRLNRILTDRVWYPVTTRLLALTTAVTLYVRRAKRLAAWVALTSLVGLATQYTIRAVVARDRPSYPDPVDSAHNFAFPSGHVMAATITGGLLLVLLHTTGPTHRGWRTAAWAAALGSVIGVGFTRAFLGVHWPTDVLASWLFGAAVVAVCTGALPPRGERAYRCRLLPERRSTTTERPGHQAPRYSSVPGGIAMSPGTLRCALSGRRGRRRGPCPGRSSTC